MGGRRPAALSWVLAALAALCLAAGALLVYAQRTVFSSDGFADRVAASLQEAPVRDAVGRRLTETALGARPDLVALRPIVEVAARGIVSAGAFRSLVRSAARDAHRVALGQEVDGVIVQVDDAGILLGEALRRVDPSAADRVPPGLRTGIARARGGVDAALIDLAQAGDRVRSITPFAFAAALVLALGALAVTDSRRAAVLRLGVALAVAGALVALAAAILPGVVAAGAAGADRDAVRAALGVWFDPLVAWALGGCLVGLLVVVAAASLVRPISVLALARRARTAIEGRRPGRRARAALALAGIAAGLAMVLAPLTVLRIVVVTAGALVLLASFAELLSMAAGPPARALEGPRRVGARRSARIVAAALALVLGVGAVAALAASSGEPDVPRTGRCNGRAGLCDRRLDEVALLGTHNSMSAAGEPGWLFAAQDAGIPAQLDDGVRSLLIDTHYGFRTSRGVITDLTGQTTSRAKLADELGETFVTTAERLRARIGARPQGPRDVFLCHAFCEVGATRATVALAGVHRFLVTHPEEVLVLSIEDDTEPADTAAVIRRSGLADEVYRGPARPPWPTLREMIDDDERVVVLTENHAGAEPWIHRQDVVAQETPFHFRTPAELQAPASCEPGRGATKGSLFLVNHWVDTSPAPRVSIAREVNAREFLGSRLARCRRERGLLPTIVAVDFWRQGDPLAVVDELNGLP